MLLWLFVFIISGINGKKDTTTETVAETTKVETSTPIETTKADETTTVAPTEETTEVAEETTEVAEETTVSEAETATELTEEEYVAKVEEAIDGDVGQNEKITGVALADRVLTINVDVSKSNDNAQIKFPLEQIALSRASSITDSLLELDTSMWDKVVVDFGDVGTVTKTTDDIVDSEYGKYFEIDCLDGQEPETKEEIKSNPLTDDEKVHCIVMAKNIIDKYVDKPKYPWGTEGFTVVRFDDKDAIMVSTDQLTLKSSDFKQSAYVVFTYYSDKLDDFVCTEHYCEVAGVKLSDDGYCDEFFKALGVK